MSRSEIKALLEHFLHILKKDNIDDERRIEIADYCHTLVCEELN